jgi:hypothetical protein
MNKVFILAGSAEQARTLARWHDMAPHEWASAINYNNLFGSRNLTLWLYGTWRDRPDASEIIVLAKSRGFKVFEIQERT